MILVHSCLTCIEPNCKINSCPVCHPLEHNHRDFTLCVKDYMKKDIYCQPLKTNYKQDTVKRSKDGLE